MTEINHPALLSQDNIGPVAIDDSSSTTTTSKLDNDQSFAPETTSTKLLTSPLRNQNHLQNYDNTSIPGPQAKNPDATLVCMPLEILRMILNNLLVNPVLGQPECVNESEHGPRRSMVFGHQVSLSLRDSIRKSLRFFIRRTHFMSSAKFILEVMDLVLQTTIL